MTDDPTAAEDVLDGTVCQICGEWFDDVLAGHEAPGHTRTCVAFGGAPPRSHKPNASGAWPGASTEIRP